MRNFTTIEKVAGIIENELGLYYPPNRYEDLLRGLSDVASIIHGSGDSSLIIREILANGSLSDNIYNVITSSLTITETYFFREAPSISLFVNKIIPQIKNSEKDFKIWCAGCSSGEEPYSLAILLRENLNSTQLEKVKILATDVNNNALDKAQNGIYTDWSFRETPAVIKEKYFRHIHGKWLVDGHIKNMVEFGKINLAREINPGKMGYEGFDLIFCRNVLMYFSPNIIRGISDRFRELLPEDGWLVVSQVELNDDYFGKFSKFSYENGIFYRKTTSLPVIKMTKQVNLRRTPDKGLKPPVKPKAPSNPATTAKKHEKINSVSDNFANLEDLYNRGNYEDCIAGCLSLCATGKESYPTNFLLAKCYANRGEYEKSVETIDKIILSGGSGEDIYYLYGTVLKEQRETKKATEALKKVLYLNPDHLFSNLLLGNILQEDGKGESAARYYRNVLEILSNIEDYHIIPESGGLTKARLREMVENLMMKHKR